MNDFLSKRQATLTIVGIYALVGGLWIYASDTVLGWLVQDPHKMVNMSIYKGSLFIVLTSLLLYFLVSRYNRSLADSEQTLKDQVKSLQESETELKATENKFHTLFESMTDGYAYVDMDGRIVEFNNAFCNMIGYTPEETRNLTYEDITPEKWRAVEREIVNSQVMVRKFSDIYEKEYRRKDGSILPVELRAYLFSDGEGKPKGMWAIIRDVSERRQAEEERANMQKQLLHTQKLESLGILAGGIAHDFNNILTAIIGNADLALMRLNKESPAIDNLRRIEQAASRAAELAKQMLAYSGKGKFVVENLDLNRLMDEMLHMLEVSISKKAVLRLNLTHSLPIVEADATQIRQIVMNLVINASEAIGDKSGVIAITTGCKECDRRYLKDVWLDENLTDGLYVYLEIADSGCGMDKETLAKLFDPFFTTKFTGRGLGMAAVLGIVRGHKGSIKVYSEKDKGTTFKILLPASNRPTEILNCDSKDDDWKGEGKVLLVDDEETVRSIGSEMLKELGFTPVTADDGLEALELFRSSPDITFVILDLTMPHMDGEQCFRELRQLKPDVKVIMSSGFSENEVTQKFVGKGLAGFIQKPYKLSVLREVIMKIRE